MVCYALCWFCQPFTKRLQVCCKIHYILQIKVAIHFIFSKYYWLFILQFHSMQTSILYNKISRCWMLISKLMVHSFFYGVKSCYSPSYICTFTALFIIQQLVVVSSIACRSSMLSARKLSAHRSSLRHTMLHSAARGAGMHTSPVLKSEQSRKCMD